MSSGDFGQCRWCMGSGWVQVASLNSKGEDTGDYKEEACSCRRPRFIQTHWEKPSKMSKSNSIDEALKKIDKQNRMKMIICES